MNEPAKIEKVTDDALSRSIISSVIGILLCMVCLVGTTWAWYSLSVESGVSVTEGANFDFNVTVAKTDTEPEVTPVDGQYSLVENGTYTVKLTKKEGCTATKGFCRVIVKSSDVDYGKYYYKQVDFSGEPNAVSFTVTVAGQYVLNITPMLGTPANPNEIPTEKIDLTPSLASKAPPPQKEEVSQEETTSEEELEPEPDPEEEIGDSTDGKGTTEPDEGGENVNENEVPDEVPANPEQAESETPSENQGNSEPAEQPVEPPAETPAEPISEIPE